MLGRVSRASRAVATATATASRSVHNAASAAPRTLLRPASGLIVPPAVKSAGARRMSLLRDERSRQQTTAPTPVSASDKAKMSIKFSLADTPGALQDALAFFTRNQINMTRLETRPSKRTSDYGQERSSAAGRGGGAVMEGK